jgi:hypothetical protein
MATKSKTTQKSWTHKQVSEEQERAIVLMVLSLPSIEHAIVSNYLDRNDYVVQEEAESDRDMQHKYGVALPGKKTLAWRAARKAAAIELHELAKKTRGENV